MKKVLFTIALMLLPMLASADAVEIDGIYYNLDTEAMTAEVTSNPDNYQGDVTIPESFEYGGMTYSVISIGEKAFYATGVTSIIIPNSVTNIGDEAFRSCRELTSVTIGNSVVSIGQYTFWGTSLTSVTIPGSVTTIGEGAFIGNSRMTSITVDESNTSYMSEDGVLLSKDGTELIVYPIAKAATVYTIPDGVTSIGIMAFSNCNGLTSVTIPNSVTSISDYAFYQCSHLSSATIPNSVTSIGFAAFSGCYNLTSVTIPDGATSIGSDVFVGTKWYKNQNDGLLYLDNWLLGYKGKAPIGAITIADGTKGIAGGAFRNCNGMTSITIPGSVIFIGGYVFQWCGSLASITVDESNPNYKSEDGVLFSKDGTTLITYPTGKTETAYTIPNSVTTIGDCAFYSCGLLTSITIPNGVASIGEKAFYQCGGLTSITIPVGVTSIGDYTFWYCGGLTSIIIPDGMATIGDYAFGYCRNLTSITIGSGIQTIASMAFTYCTELMDVYCYAKNVTTTEDAFSNSNYNNATLHVPAGSIEAYKAAEPWNQFKKIVALEEDAIDGNLNDDDVVDADDVVALVKMIAAGDASAVGDLNGDGKVDVADVVMLVNIITGQ